MMARMLASLIVLCTLLYGVTADYYIFQPGTVANATDTPISSGCATALEAQLSCDPYLMSITQADLYANIDKDSHDKICVAACGTSLASYRSNVASACKNDPQPWEGLPATYFGDVLSASYNLTCLQDPSTGQYCVDYIAQLTADSQIQDTSQIVNLPAAQACSPCVLGIGRLVSSTPYSNFDENMAVDWAALATYCKTTLPTAVPSLNTNVTNPVGHAPLNYTTSSDCLSGNHYTVVAGDDCGKIANANKVAVGTLITLNNVLPDCTNLQVGQQLCLPQTCTLYTVKSGDTCVDIANTASITFVQLLSYNPSINSLCGNLIAGQDICISLPGGAVYTPTTISNAPAATSSSYATATVSPPGPVAHGTTPKCGKYYTCQSGDVCQLITLNYTITFDLFRNINPSVDANCDNLVPGLNYCVQPTADWNVTSGQPSTTSSVASPGAPTPSGTIRSCYEYHTVVSGDTCQLIQSSYDITFDQLQKWNPDLKPDCSNLILGDAYCIHGFTPTAVTPPGPTPTGTTPNCFQWYTVQSGDDCSKITAKYGITFALFQFWNPSIDDTCDNLLLGDAYCIDGKNPVDSGTRSKTDSNKWNGGFTDAKDVQQRVIHWIKRIDAEVQISRMSSQVTGVAAALAQ